MLFFQNVFLNLHDLMQLLQHTESIYIFFIDSIFWCFGVFYSVRRIYIWSTTIDSDLFYEICNTRNEHNGRQTHYLLIDFSNQIWYQETSELKSFLVTSSALPLIMISLLSLFNHFIVFRRNKINCCFFFIFHLSDVVRLFMISFKYGLILLRYFSRCFTSITFTFIFNIIVTPKITHSYWFIIIFLFFMLKKISIIS